MTQKDRKPYRDYYGRGLIAHLITLPDKANDPTDRRASSAARAELANLRRGRDEPLRIACHVLPCLQDPKPGFEAESVPTLYMLASLFAWHRRHEDNVSLGMAYRKLRDKRESSDAHDKQKSMGPTERRFLALLTASPDRLESHLQHDLRLLESEGIALDWHWLTDDVLRWGLEGRPRQHQLARDFYRREADSSDDSTEDTASDAITSEGEPEE